MRAVFLTAAFLVAIGMSIVLLLLTAGVKPSSEHAVSTCPTSRLFRDINEQVQPDHIAVGDSITINGELVSLVNRNILIKSFPLVLDQDSVLNALNYTADNRPQCGPFSPPLSKLNQTLTTAFQVINSSQSNEFVLGPGASVSYTIQLKSLHPGTYSIQTEWVYNLGGNSSDGAYPGQGAEINVYVPGYAAKNQTYTVNMDNSTNSFRYSLYGAKTIENVVADPKLNYISMVLDSGYPGSTGAELEGILQISFPKALLDKVFGPHQFLPFVDGQSAEYSTTYSSCDRVDMTIQFHRDSQKISFVRSDIFINPQAPYIPRSFPVEPGVRASNSEFVELRTDTDASSCAYTMPELNRLHVDINGTTAKPIGYFGVLLPDTLVHENYTIYVDGHPANFTDNVASRSYGYDGTKYETHYLAINYPRGAKSIDIIGTSVTPEFGSAPLTAVGATSFAVLMRISLRKWNVYPGQ